MYPLPIDRLSPELFGLWSDLHDRAEPPLGPFLHPAYVQAVGKAKPGVAVGVVTRRGAVAGFIPFQRLRFNVGGPVGGRLCDLCGAVVDSGWDADAEELAHRFGLRALRLPNVATGDPILEGATGRSRRAYHMDLSPGF